MANEIGQILQGPAAAPPTGAPPSPGATIASAPPTETENPAITWLRQPENLMTALVFLGSIVQPREEGRNGFQTLMQRGLGAVTFRNALNNSQVEQGLARDKEKADTEESKSQKKFREDSIGVGRAQVEATKEGNAMDLQANQAHLAALQSMNASDNATRMAIAELEGRIAQQTAQVQKDIAGMKDADSPFISAEDIIKIQEIAAGNGIPFQDALQNFARVRAMTDPRFAAMLQMGQPPAAPAAAAAPGAKPKPKPKPNSYRSVPQAVPATGLPNYQLGESVGTGSHTAPGKSYPLYPGQK